MGYFGEGVHHAIAQENPIINSYLSENRIDSWGWISTDTLNLTINYGGAVVHTDSQTPSPWIWEPTVGYANFVLGPGFILKPGQVITISNGTETKSTIVMDLYVDFYDPIAKIVTGYSESNTSVKVNMWFNGGELLVTPDAFGHWQASYSTTLIPFYRGIMEMSQVGMVMKTLPSIVSIWGTCIPGQKETMSCEMVAHMVEFIPCLFTTNPQGKIISMRDNAS